MQIHAFRCFGETADEGNSALVIEDDRSSSDVRQNFARERNVTCVWIDPSNEPGVAAIVDYFYPHARSRLCLHATLAVGYRMCLIHGVVGDITVKTAVHGQRLGLSATTIGELFIRLQVQQVLEPHLSPDLVERLLAAPGLTQVSLPRVASVGSPKLLVEVPDLETLYAVTPDLQAIASWGSQVGVNGLYVYCRLGNGRYEGRNFNHLDPTLEDSATGVAAGALTALLGHGIILQQGRTTGSACMLHTRVHGRDIFVGGRVQPA